MPSHIGANALVARVPSRPQVVPHNLRLKGETGLRQHDGKRRRSPPRPRLATGTANQLLKMIRDGLRGVWPESMCFTPFIL